MRPSKPVVSSTGETWSPSAETLDRSIRSPAPIQPAQDGGILRCGPQSVPGVRTQARIAGNVAEEAARRIGTVAILTAVTTVGMAVLQNVLQPEMAAAQQTPLYRLSALSLVLAAVAVAALQRSELVNPQRLLDLGLVLEIVGSLAISLMENSMPWADSGVRGTTTVAAWIAICVVVIPNRPWKSILAAFTSAAIVPLAHLLAAHTLGYPPLAWNRLAASALGPFFVAAWTPFISTRIRRMQEDLSRTQDLGSYHLEKRIGQGGMGEVWLARHRFLCRDAAVKIVLPRLLQGISGPALRQTQRRFEVEAQAIASLRSPHTVAIYDFGLAENGSLYYAMEFLEGLDAETLINSYGALPAGRVISFLKQACESLEEAHEEGLVHRDVKASNLFICRLGKRTDFVKLLDFGLVKTLPGSAQTAFTTDNNTSGTPAFMSPEQVRGDQVDARADIYGLGCVAYFLLTGSVVFKKSSPMATALAQATEQPEPPSTRSELPIAPSLERVVMACLEKNREARPQSAAELREMLEACTDVPPWTHADANQWWLLHRPQPVRA